MAANLLFPEDQITSLKIKSVLKRDGRLVRFDRQKIANSIFRAAVEVGGSDRQLAESLADKVVALLNDMYPLGATPTVEEIQDLTEKVLVENGHYLTAKAYILYRAERKKLRLDAEENVAVEDNIPYKILWKVYSWNVDHNCDTVEKLNQQIRDDTYPQLVKAAEEAYHQEIDIVAEKIIHLRDRLRLIIVAGPSSSGKTTTTTKISERLQKYNISFVLLNLDNYFKNLEEHPKDEYGDYDFETPQALDLALINEHLYRLLQGKTIKMPVYDFKIGKRLSETVELTLTADQILLIDSLHGLYPEMTESVPHEMKFKFYIEALSQIKDNKGEFVRWSDLRMMRRMVRDSWHRSYDPLRTVGHWHYVRRSEKRHIVPFINKVDYVFNGALPYELPVHKKYLFKYFPKIVETYKDDPKKLDAYIRAQRVYELLKEVEEIKDESIIPKNSLMREFIGGSIYKY